MSTEQNSQWRLGSEPAAPCNERRPEWKDVPHAPSDGYVNHLGLTKREYFAGLAMQGLCGAIAMELQDNQLRDFSQCCVHMADALLVELAK